MSVLEIERAAARAGRVAGSLASSRPREASGIDALQELALDLRWSWSHQADDLWRRLDPELWELTQNPWVVLQTVSRDRLRRSLDDPRFRKDLAALSKAKRREARSPAWFQRAYPGASLSRVAYLSMEFMLSEALPIYSGGLGNVAGDQLKAASDLGVPVTGVGLLYQQGYFRQALCPDGSQRAVFPYNDPGQLPIAPLRRTDGEWLRLRIPMADGSVWLRVWQARVGRTCLYLLDSNDAANLPTYRGVTGELYGGDLETRLQQEIVLGIGGWRLLARLGAEPEVCHLNEGHAAFAVLERARCLAAATGSPFAAALDAARAGNLFTTHTAVAAGFDLFPPEMVERYLRAYARQELGIGVEDVLAMGRRPGGDPSEAFNMAFLAARGSGAVSAVSRLHARVSRRIFQPLFPRWPEAEVPVSHVTNGVHTPSWDSSEADELWTGACGKRRWIETLEAVGADVRKVSDEALWRLRAASRGKLVQFIRRRASRQLAAEGASPEAVERAKSVLDPDALTLGFARRFSEYKRPHLLLLDPDRLLRLLGDPRRPVQLILAGKAHPADPVGQALLQRWIRFIRGQPAWGVRMVFLRDYDMLLAERLVQGVDLWLNTPRRPWEASGTSGMKVLVNGGLNLSELDGWWAEAYSPEVGWAIGDGREHGDDPAWDRAEARALYDILEREVVPAFYDRDARGVPPAWVARMRESMARLTPRFSANRAVREYVERHYLPAAERYRRRAARLAEEGRAQALWRESLERHWAQARFEGVTTVAGEGMHRFETRIRLGGLDPASVRAELYADPAGEHGMVREAMSLVEGPRGPDGVVLYRGAVSAARPATDYTPRLVPFHPGVEIPLEAPLILWAR